MLGERQTIPEFTLTSGVNSTSMDMQLTSSAKLPTIDVPKFSGNYGDWESFKNLCTSLVHDLSTLTDSTK